jgi:putative NIF3 family GTP cyclohydrolase 1 type 2
VSHMNPISRREFIALAATSVVTRPVSPITAQEIVERIKQKIGIEWKTDTVDTFKAGDPGAVVKGIATTAMPTMNVLKQAVKNGANLIITCEPTFYSKSDRTLSTDPVFQAKDEFIKTNRLVIWRFSDHWRLRIPNPLAIGLTDAMGWSKLRSAEDPTRITIPTITLDALAADLKRKLKARGGIRVVGDPQLKIQKIALLPGTTPIQSALALLPNVDVVIAGEVREWESVEYARDKVTAGEKKSLILLGRVISEDPGMNVCATWIKTIVPELNATWIAAGDPYWRPV